MSTLFLSLLLVVLIAIGLLMAKPIREHFADPSKGITDDEWEQIPVERRKMMLTQCHFVNEMPQGPESAYMNAVCKYVKSKLSLKQEFDGYKKETIAEMQPWCDYLKTNYAPVASNPAASKADPPKPVNEELSQLQLNLERKCRQMALNMDETITPQNQEYWTKVCTSLNKVKNDKTRQLDVAAQQPYDDDEEVQKPVKKNKRTNKKTLDSYEGDDSETQDRNCPDMSHYIKMDEVPCWNCSLP